LKGDEAQFSIES